ncbi:hypothetical protein ALC56_05163, partial [Trachymyrmex septentrionalis]
HLTVPYSFEIQKLKSIYFRRRLGEKAPSSSHLKKSRRRRPSGPKVCSCIQVAYKDPYWSTTANLMKALGISQELSGGSYACTTCPVSNLARIARKTNLLRNMV